MNTFYCATQINPKTPDVTLNKKKKVIGYLQKEILFDTSNLATAVNFFKKLIS